MISDKTRNMAIKIKYDKIFEDIQAGAPYGSYITCAYLLILWLYAMLDAVKQIYIMNALPEQNIVLAFSAAMYVILISIALIYSVFILEAYRSINSSTWIFPVGLATAVYMEAIALILSITVTIGYTLGQTYLIASDIAAITYQHNLRLYYLALIAQSVITGMYFVILILSNNKNHSNSTITNSNGEIK